MERPVLERAASIFASLSHPTRLRIIELLIEGDRTAAEIASRLSSTPAGASLHLTDLVRSGILITERHDGTTLYKLRGPRIPKSIALVEEFCEAHSLYGYDWATGFRMEGTISGSQGHAG